jgi:hypothetical protein
MTVPVDIHVTADVPPEGVDQLLHDVRAIGLDPTLKAVPMRRGGVNDLLWQVLLALPAQIFFEVLVQKFADEAYSQLKVLVGKALHRRCEPQDCSRVLMLQDKTTGLRVVLESDLPLDAYQQLFLVNLSSITPGLLRYDQNRKEWRAEPDGRNDDSVPS